MLYISKDHQSPIVTFCIRRGIAIRGSALQASSQSFTFGIDENKTTHSMKQYAWKITRFMRCTLIVFVLCEIWYFVICDIATTWKHAYERHWTKNLTIWTQNHKNRFKWDKMRFKRWFKGLQTFQSHKCSNSKGNREMYVELITKMKKLFDAMESWNHIVKVDSWKLFQLQLV
jgi:hypothetical protein